MHLAWLSVTECGPRHEAARACPQAAPTADAGPERATSGGAPKVELSNQELLKAMPEAEKKKLRAARCCELWHIPRHPKHTHLEPRNAPTAEAKHRRIAPARLHGVTVARYPTALHQLRRFGGGGAAVGPLSKVDLAEEMRKRKERAKKFGLPVPVFAAEVRSYKPGAWHNADIARNLMRWNRMCCEERRDLPRHPQHKLWFAHGFACVFTPRACL